MNNLKQLMMEIIQITSNIEGNYPELYQFLEEDPITIPAGGFQVIGKETLQDYLESLKSQLKHHLETHRNNSGFKRNPNNT